MTILSKFSGESIKMFGFIKNQPNKKQPRSESFTPTLPCIIDYIMQAYIEKIQ